jgi:hypothetical protein
VNHIGRAPDIPVLTASHDDVVFRGNRPPAIHSRTGRMMSCAIVDDRVVEEGRPNQ